MTISPNISRCKLVSPHSGGIVYKNNRSMGWRNVQKCSRKCPERMFDTRCRLAVDAKYVQTRYFAISSTGS